MRSAIRWQLLDAQGCLCALCGKFMDAADQTFDHIIPISRGGTDAISNIRLTHRTCNERRGHQLSADDLRLVRALKAARAEA